MFASCDQPTTLTDALAAKGLSYTKLARKCGVTQSAVSHWAAGNTRPSGPSRLAISRALRLPLPVVESWFEKAAA